MPSSILVVSVLLLVVVVAVIACQCRSSSSFFFYADDDDQQQQQQRFNTRPDTSIASDYGVGGINNRQAHDLDEKDARPAVSNGAAGEKASTDTPLRDGVYILQDSLNHRALSVSTSTGRMSTVLGLGMASTKFRVERAADGRYSITSASTGGRLQMIRGAVSCLVVDHGLEQTFTLERDGQAFTISLDSRSFLNVVEPLYLVRAGPPSPATRWILQPV